MSINAFAQFESAPAFPGAEGFGRFTTGGRGGTVKHVTNLNDSGTGSLRAAVEGTAKKIVVFDVAGYIDLKSDLKIGSNTTILGQTAPGDGITVRYRTVVFTSCDNVICRYIRFRRSQLKDVNDGADATWGRQHKNIILDHCSFSWSIDEIASFYDNRDFTMQWCTLGEALANPGHSKGEHSYGGIWGGKGASFHHNYLTHMQNRVPRFNGARYVWNGYDTSKYANSLQAEQVDFRNCVMYNWGTGGCYGGPGGGYVNMINNYYKAGPGTKNRNRVTQVSVANSGNASGYETYWGYASRYYINGNYVHAAGSSAENYDWKGVVYESGLKTYNGEYYIPDAKHYFGNVEYTNVSGTDCVRLRLDEPIEAGYITTHSAKTAYDKVLKYAGASYARDSVDLRYMNECTNGTVTYTGSKAKVAGIIDMINDPATHENDPTKASYPQLNTPSRPAGYDSDNDGMPDAWEIANGLNPYSASDQKTYTIDSERKYYTNLEVYANWLVEPQIKDALADAISGFDEYYPSVVDPNILGDANIDGQVDVADITTVASFILGTTPKPWSPANADANADGTIDVADITAIASIILN